MESPASSLCMATCTQGTSPSACAGLSSASAEKQSAPSTLFFHCADCFKNAAMDRFAPCRGVTVSRVSAHVVGQQCSGRRACGEGVHCITWLVSHLGELYRQCLVNLWMRPRFETVTRTQ